MRWRMAFSKDFASFFVQTEPYLSPAGVGGGGGFLGGSLDF